jgi:hypothetical protein
MKVSRQIGNASGRWSTHIEKHMQVHRIVAVKSSVKLHIQRHSEEYWTSIKIVNFFRLVKPRQRALAVCSLLHLPSCPVPTLFLLVAGLLAVQRYVRDTSRQARMIG